MIDWKRSGLCLCLAILALSLWSGSPALSQEDSAVIHQGAEVEPVDTDAVKDLTGLEEDTHHEGEVGHDHGEDHGEHAAAHDEHGHDDHGHHEEHPPELPDLLMVGLGLPYAIGVPLYSIFVAVLLVLLARYLTRNLSKIPTRGQSLVETYVELMDSFTSSILGPEMGRRYLPFVGTLWVYIWFMNLFCLVPGGFAPTSVLQQTFALSITVFLYVQYTAFRYQGPGGYLFHLMGEPRDAIGWALAPLFLPLHVLGEFIKPLSLALRLRGNILGEDILLGVFSALGIMLISVLGWQDPLFGIPLHLPMMALVLLGSTIQATVFTVLTTIYISMSLPHHEDHGEGHSHAH
jgi:F-type H+-transporting ATPase subunit a